MMQPSKSAETDVADLRKCKLVNELADPELTAVYAKIRTKSVSATTIVTLTASERICSRT